LVCEWKNRLPLQANVQDSALNWYTLIKNAEGVVNGRKRTDDLRSMFREAHRHFCGDHGIVLKNENALAEKDVLFWHPLTELFSG
jgi:hypothetical protein